MSITRVQSNGLRNASTASNTVTLGAGVALGNLLVAEVSVIGAAVTITPPAGWTLAVGNAGSVTPNASIYYLVVAAGQVGTTSFVFNFSASANNNLIITEWNSSTGWIASPVDKTATNNAATQTTIPSGTTATTTQATELWVAGLVYAGAAQTETSLTTGWTSGFEAAGGPTLREVYEVVSATGAAAVSFVIGTAQNTAGAIATFKPASAANPVLSTSPSTLSFSATVGGANPASQNDTLSETAGIGTAWTSAITYGSGSGWLAISPTSGTLTASGNQVVAFTCTTGSLAAGTYTATVTYTATTGGATATVGVTFVVSAAGVATLSTSPATLSFSATSGGASPASQNDTLSNTGGASSAWTSAISYGSGSGWLSISPASGTLGAGANAVVAFSCVTTGLSVGTYTATVTYTATTGGSTATVSVSFVVSSSGGGGPFFLGAGFSIKLAGVDITSHVDEASISIVDALGQGAGTGGGGVGRAKTASFLTDLGPLSQAVGAGTVVTTPTLVRQGEVTITDVTGTAIYGGFASNYQDVTEKTTILTLINCVDYWQHLDRVVVNEIYDGNTDIFMVKDLLTKYAPWLSQASLPAAPSFTFQTKNYRHFTLQAALTDICSVTGYQIWIDTSKHVHYESPTTAAKASFGLSDTPDFFSTFPCAVTDNTLDDAAAINRVYFYGGKTASGDITQNVSNQAVNGNKIFTLAYYPHAASDGKIHVNINSGSDLVLGTAFGPVATNTLKSAGGTCDVLLDSSSSTLTFDVAHDGQQVTVTYRYQIPLVVVLTDEASHQFFGSYLDGVIVDSSIFDKQQAIQRCKALLLEQHRGLQTLNISTWTPGIRSGQIVTLTHAVRQISQSFMCQQVTVVPLGGGSFRYDLQVGAWDFNFIDVLLSATRNAVPQDTTQNDTTVQIDVQLGAFLHTNALTTATKQGPVGGVFYTGATFGSVNAAQAGFFSINSNA